VGNLILDAYNSLSKSLNKVKGQQSPETEQGVVSEKFPELKLEMDSEQIIKLTRKWEKTWNQSEVFNTWDKKSTENEEYWLGNQFDRSTVEKTRATVDNVIFEALETYLPQVTRRNPDPMITLSEMEQQTPENQQFASHLQKKLGEVSDELKLRLKLKKVARHWAIYLLGVAKLSWDVGRDIPTAKITRLRKLILDPDALVDEDGYTGEFIGEHRTMQAGILIKTLEASDGEADGIKAVKDLVGEDLGTNIRFIEWWTNEYVCWTMNSSVLWKKKNPHWNYELPPAEPQLDATGQPMQVPEPTKPVNHFKTPQKPYLFLTVFNIGKQPLDDTSLIGQNLYNQDRINKRSKQIDRNADSMNGGMVVSLERSGLTKDQASGVTEALRKGGTIAIPTGAVGDAVQRMSAPGLPADIYNDLQDTRNRTKDIFGTRGSSAAGLESDTTVRGKLMNRQLDTDRIGGGFSEYLEQMADDIFNWWVQLLYVYDNDYSQQPVKPEIKVSVKEGSLLPKDSTTIANQAIELANSGKMSIIDLYKRLDYPNPLEIAANVWLEKNAPEVLFDGDERIKKVIADRQQASAPEAKLPSESINFKDLPPDGQAQMAAKAGIQLHPEAIAAHNDHVAAQDQPVIPQPIPQPIINQ
jgi:hypothetical protein